MMLYRVLKLVVFTVKKQEAGKVVETLGRDWGRTEEFRK